MPPSSSSPSRPLVLLLLVAITISLAACVRVGPANEADTGRTASDSRGVPDTAQLPADPPPARTAQPLPVPTDPTPTPTPTPTPGRGRARATRIVIRYLGIDLPIISRDRRVPDQGPDLYPPCDVAIYHTAFEQPGRPGTTYLYGHAREGMFLPLLKASERDDGKAILGKVVRVYTSDDRLHLYRITKVKRHATDFSLVTDAAPDAEQLILQTSEGPRGTVPKLQVVAEPYAVRAATREEARPRPRPRACYDTP